MSASPDDALELDRQEQELLDRYGFDYATFARLRAELQAGRFPPERNRLRAPIEPPREADLTALPAEGSREGAACEKLGRELLEAGKVAVVILNGGMATRFGGRVKGAVEVTSGLSFLGLKLRDLVRAPGPVQVFLMNSFATEAETRRHLEHHQGFGLSAERLHLVAQRISIRLTPQGDLVRRPDGGVDFYAPGHGDLFEVLAASPAFEAFVQHGGRLILVSNVDNLGATLSTRVLGAHLEAGRKVTIEVAPRAPGDKGGAPARVGDRVEVVEGFRFPAGFDIERIPVFNTNTMLLDVEAVRSDYALSWFRADKEAWGQPVVQFERLMGEVTAFVSATYLTVPRDGPEGRFFPVKTPDDLKTIQLMVHQRFAGLLAEGLK